MGAISEVVKLYEVIRSAADIPAHLAIVSLLVLGASGFVLLRAYARHRIRVRRRTECKVLEALRFMHEFYQKKLDDESGSDGAKAVVYDGLLANYGLLTARDRNSYGDNYSGLVNYIAYVTTLVEIRGLETTCRYLWPIERQPRRWKRRTKRGGRRSRWEKLLDWLGEEDRFDGG